MEDMAERMVEVGIAARRKEIVGCSFSEISGIESRFNLKLPAAYRAFLIVMGRSAGSFYEGTDHYYPRILDLRDGALELLREDGAGFVLPDDAFVFSMHQGYQFLFFRICGGDDPPIFHYMEGSGRERQVDGSFTGFMQGSFEEHHRHIAEEGGKWLSRLRRLLDDC